MNIKRSSRISYVVSVAILVSTIVFDIALSQQETKNGTKSDNPSALDERLSLPGPVLFPEQDPDTCRSPDDRAGLCVEINYCPQLKKISLNNLRKFICGFQQNTPLLCCEGLQKPQPQPQPPEPYPYPQPQPQPQPQPNPQPHPQPNPQPYPQPNPQPHPNPDPFRRPPKPDFLPRECGLGAFQANRIVGGREAAKGAYPWIVAIFVEFGGQKIHSCGGSLVSQRHVVSAAHCFFDGQNPLPFNIYRMRIGDYDITKEDDIEGTLEIKIVGYRTHPGYVRKTYLNDISISYLADEVRFTKFIGPVCLPYTGFQEDLTSSRAIVAGWGYTKYQGGSSNPILKETDIPIWSLTDCAKAFKAEVNITDDYLCAGDPDGKTDSCQGDSGGPLIMWGEDNRYYLIGVVSFGKRCATPGYPGAYTRMTKQLQWLNENF